MNPQGTTGAPHCDPTGRLHKTTRPRADPCGHLGRKGGQRRRHLLLTHDLRCPGPASVPMTSHSPRRRLWWHPLSTALAKLPSSFRTQVPQAHPVGASRWGQLGGSASRRARGGVPTQHSQWRLGGPEGGFTVPGVWEPGTPWETLGPAETQLAKGVELDA